MIINHHYSQSAPSIETILTNKSNTIRFIILYLLREYSKANYQQGGTAGLTPEKT